MADMTNAASASVPSAAPSSSLSATGAAALSASSSPADGWLTAAKDDIDQWAAVMPKDADGTPIDWQWVRSLDLAGGIGHASDADFAPGAAGTDAHDLLAADYAVRDRLESIIAQCSTAFMTDFDRLIASYRLPRALAYANRRLADEIALLIDRGVAEGHWTVHDEQRGRVSVPVLVPTDGTDVADIQDRTADIDEARSTRRKARMNQERAGRSGMAQANLDAAVAVAAGGPATGMAPTSAKDADAAAARRAADYGRPDWRSPYLPGRDVADVIGIDIETTGTDPARDYIIDVGFECMDVSAGQSADPSATPGAPGAPAASDAGYRYERESYAADGAYGQARLPFGVTARAARHGNPFIARLTGIDIAERGPGSGIRLFDEWPAAQRGLLMRLEQRPYVAHNATFEHKFFMLAIAGYAESYRAGRITIIDTMPMSRQWDPGSAPDDAHPYGDNRLESYARRQGALSEDEAERHLGLEDAHIMLVAMRRHLADLRVDGRGPWGADGRGGVGGKRCGRRY